MGSRHEKEACVIEDMIYVAVGKNVKESKSILLWALQNFGGKRICILHVHQPAQLIPFSKFQIPVLSIYVDMKLEFGFNFLPNFQHFKVEFI